VTADDYSLRLIAALTALWNAIRQRHPEVPAVVLLPAPSLAKKMNVLGHFAPLRWKGRRSNDDRLHEVLVVAEHLDRGAEEVLDTLLHEAAHAANHERGVKDCSRSQYHNSAFRKMAESLGLTVQQVPNYGHAQTTLPPATAQLYETGLAALREVLISRRRPIAIPTGTPTGVNTPNDDNEPDGGDSSRSRHLKATCACGFVIRASKKTLQNTVIRCETCGEPFRASP
jgi:hypothetical protein